MAVELETERLRLRQWREADVDAFHAFYCDPVSVKIYGGEVARHDVWRRIAVFIGHWQIRGFGMWALEERAGSAFVGFAGLWCPPEFGDVEVGWGLAAAHRGKGYATEAASCARDYGFAVAHLDRLVSYILPDNHPSIAVAKRLGAAPDGEYMLHSRLHAIYRHPRPST